MDPGIIRSIGSFQATVTVREQHHDDMTITSHPVERGAAISDHAFKNPAKLTVECLAAASAQSLTDIYQRLIILMQSASLLTVQTGKRLYQNMLIQSLSVTTDPATENILSINTQLQEVILVDTLQTTMPTTSVRATPIAASGVANSGAKAPKAYTPPRSRNNS